MAAFKILCSLVFSPIIVKNFKMNWRLHISPSNIIVVLKRALLFEETTSLAARMTNVFDCSIQSQTPWSIRLQSQYLNSRDLTFSMVTLVLVLATLIC